MKNKKIKEYIINGKFDMEKVADVYLIMKT